jgi:hypothetical protein
MTSGIHKDWQGFVALKGNSDELSLPSAVGGDLNDLDELLMGTSEAGNLLRNDEAPLLLVVLTWLRHACISCVRKRSNSSMMRNRASLSILRTAMWSPD